jgi:hypothetical protein
MKALLFTLSFFVVSVGNTATVKMTWDKNLIAKLKNQTAFSVFCQKPKGVFAKEACAESAKDPGFKKFKFKVMEMVSATTIRVGDGPRSVEISFGAKSGQYTLNSRTIDFATMTAAEITEKISSALPRVAAASFLMNNAYAAEETFIYLNKAVHAMLASTSDKKVCEDTQTVVDICEGTATMTGADALAKAQSNYAALLAKGSVGIEELKGAAVKVEEAADRASSFLDLSAGLVKHAYGKTPDLCEVTVKDKKAKAQEVLSKCQGQFEQKQNEINEALKAMSSSQDSAVSTALVEKVTEQLNDINFAMTKHSRPQLKKVYPPQEEQGQQQ